MLRDGNRSGDIFLSLSTAKYNLFGISSISLRYYYLFCISFSITRTESSEIIYQLHAALMDISFAFALVL